MYVSYMDYQGFARGDVLTEEEYGQVAPYADLIINNWTLDRVGKAFSNGEELPECVKAVYVSIVDNIDALTGSQELVSHFSNGVDSFTFDVSGSKQSAAYRLALELLPVEWISGCVSFKGGNAYAC